MVMVVKIIHWIIIVFGFFKEFLHTLPPETNKNQARLLKKASFSTFL